MLTWTKIKNETFFVKCNFKFQNIFGKHKHFFCWWTNFENRYNFSNEEKNEPENNMKITKIFCICELKLENGNIIWTFEQIEQETFSQFLNKFPTCNVFWNSPTYLNLWTKLEKWTFIEFLNKILRQEHFSKIGIFFSYVNRNENMKVFWICDFF